MVLRFLSSQGPASPGRTRAPEANRDTILRCEGFSQAVSGLRLGVLRHWSLGLALLLVYCVTLGRSLALSELGAPTYEGRRPDNKSECTYGANSDRPGLGTLLPLTR